MLRTVIGCAAVTALLGFPAPAAAAPPPNDMRTAPQELGRLPALVSGTTAEATMEADEPPSQGPAIKNSVWFSFTVSSDRELLVALDAAGDMDAVVDLFARERSQLTPVDSERTNRRGESTIDADAEAGTAYLVRVAPLANSAADRFTLRVVLPDEPAQPPGDRLPAAGTSGKVDRFANPDDAWATRMLSGRTYRINLVTIDRGRVRVALYAPGEFGGAPEEVLLGDAHSVFTPPSSGVYTLHAQAPRRSRASLGYRLRVGLAGRDDTAPGIVLPNDRRAVGTLNGRELDALDLYRFTVAVRSDVRVRLRTRRDFDLRLLTDSGRRIGGDTGFAGSKEVTERLRPGRYFIVVRARDGARGRYALTRLGRVITRATTLVDGSRSTTAAPGETVQLAVRVTPSVTGPATLLVERHDPIAGWLFHARYAARVSGAAATVVFQPPFVGRWRVTGEYEGTRTSSPSHGGTARFSVLEPLTG
jgi:hypothetical protein